MTVDPGVVAANLATVRARVADAARRAGRDPADVELLAAVKYVGSDDLPALHEAGIRLVGENRTDALRQKQAEHAHLFAWDFIGKLQSRKARDLVGHVRLIHSIDSLSTCEQLDRRSPNPVPCLLEVNVAGEASKAGVPRADVDRFLEAVEPLGGIRFEGLMTMPPLASSAEGSRRAFATLRDLNAQLRQRWFPRHGFERLSMGTSQDFEVAVEEGATVVRLGSVLYGRPDG
jgi:pyridoxal phosphate enzyme (YggS family)